MDFSLTSHSPWLSTHLSRKRITSLLRCHLSDVTHCSPQSSAVTLCSGSQMSQIHLNSESEAIFTQLILTNSERGALWLWNGFNEYAMQSSLYWITLNEWSAGMRPPESPPQSDRQWLWLVIGYQGLHSAAQRKLSLLILALHEF